MQLYFSPMACSIASRITLYEAGLDADFTPVTLQTKKLEDGADYFPVNPKGKVPTLLLENGKKLTDGTAIMTYLADLAPTSGLMPAIGSIDRYEVQSWLDFISTELHKGVVWFQFHPAPPPEAKSFALSALENQLTYVNGELTNRNYLVGERFTIADAYLFWALMILQKLQISIVPYPALTAFYERCEARPAIARSMQEETALMAA